MCVCVCVEAFAGGVVWGVGVVRGCGCFGVKLGVLGWVEGLGWLFHVWVGVFGGVGSVCLFWGRIALQTQQNSFQHCANWEHCKDKWIYKRYL